MSPEIVEELCAIEMEELQETINDNQWHILADDTLGYRRVNYVLSRLIRANTSQGVGDVSWSLTVVDADVENAMCFPVGAVVHIFFFGWAESGVDFKSCRGDQCWFCSCKIVYSCFSC